MKISQGEQELIVFKESHIILLKNTLGYQGATRHNTFLLKINKMHVTFCFYLVFSRLCLFMRSKYSNSYPLKNINLLSFKQHEWLTCTLTHASFLHFTKDQWRFFLFKKTASELDSAIEIVVLELPQILCGCSLVTQTMPNSQILQLQW